MNNDLIRQLGDTLYGALTTQTTVAPLTETHPDITIEDAYKISLHLLEQRLAAGERVIGKKIGVTSAAVMDMLDVRQPDFGFMTDAMRYDGEMPISKTLIQPRAEGEVAFLLKKNLNRARHYQYGRCRSHRSRCSLFRGGRLPHSGLENKNPGHRG